MWQGHIPSLSAERESEELIHTRSLIWTGLKMDERNPSFADSLLSVCSVCIFLPCLQGFGLVVCFSFKSWAKCFYYIQLERHLDQSFITPTFNQDGLQTGEAIPPAPSKLKFRRLYDLFFGRCCGSTASTAFQLPQWETPIGKSRAPQCKYCFLFTHKQKTVTDTENTVMLHSFPKQT